MRTWIVGDSLIGQAGSTNAQLAGGGAVTWKGVGGSRFFGLISRVLRYHSLLGNTWPTTIILHVGTCELFRSNLGDIRKRLRETLLGIRELSPRVRLIWSDILPRQFYEEEFEEGCGKRSTITLNKYAHQVVRKELTNACFIRHSHIFNPLNDALFSADGLHLSDDGKVALQRSLSDGLVFFNANPGSVSYPPLG